MVAVRVRLGRVRVLDLDALDVHGKGSLREVGLAASPLHGTLALRGTAGPDTEAHAHRGLGVAGAALGLASLERADDLAVDGPGGGFLTPGDFVLVELLLGGIDVDPGLAVVGGGVTLAKVVGLDLTSLATNGFLELKVRNNINHGRMR